MPTQTHRWVVDSVEEHVAAIEVDGHLMVRLPQWILPRGAEPGHVLSVTHELGERGTTSTLRIELDRAATRRAERASAEQTRKGERQMDDPGGDIVL
jgi:hypothetical protein